MKEPRMMQHLSTVEKLCKRQEVEKWKEEGATKSDVVYKDANYAKRTQDQQQIMQAQVVTLA